MKKVTLYIPEEQHRQLAACLATHGQKISPLALRLLKNWCEEMKESADQTSDEGGLPAAGGEQVQDAVLAVQSILTGDNESARAGLLVLLQTWAPDVFGATHAHGAGQ